MLDAINVVVFVGTGRHQGCCVSWCWMSSMLLCLLVLDVISVVLVGVGCHQCCCVSWCWMSSLLLC